MKEHIEVHDTYWSSMRGVKVTKTVEADIVSDHFAIVKERAGYRIYHIPSGFALKEYGEGYYRYKETAKRLVRLAEEIDPRHVNWDSKSPITDRNRNGLVLRKLVKIMRLAEGLTPDEFDVAVLHLPRGL